MNNVDPTQNHSRTNNTSEEHFTKTQTSINSSEVEVPNGSRNSSLNENATEFKAVSVEDDYRTGLTQSVNVSPNDDSIANSIPQKETTSPQPSPTSSRMHLTKVQLANSDYLKTQQRTTSEDSFMTAKESLGGNQTITLSSNLVLQHKHETGTNQESRVSAYSKGQTASPGTTSYMRNDITNTEYYEDALEGNDTSIGNIKMVFDRSIDMSLMEDDKAGSDNLSQKPTENNKLTQSNRQFLKPIQELDDEDRDHITKIDEKNSLADSQQSATFPIVPIHMQHLTPERSVSVENIQEQDRRDTFRPPFDPTQQRYSKDRKDTDNFTFSKKVDPGMKNYMKSAENPFQSLFKTHSQQVTIEETSKNKLTSDLEYSEKVADISMGVDSRGRAVPAQASTGRNKSKKGVSTGSVANTSLDYTYNSYHKKLIRKSRKSGKSDRNIDDDERNALLEDNTLPYLFSDGDGYRDHKSSVSSDTCTNASLIFESHHTRWFHRCFKCNIALNIAMLITFILIILLAPWYKISYTPDNDPTKHLTALFSLLLISFTTVDSATQKTYYYRIFSVEFFNVCDKCDDGTTDPSYQDDCDQVESFCDDTSETRTNIFIYILFIAGILAIILHIYAIVCGVGIITRSKLKCCRLSFPLRNIFMIHLILAGSVFGTLCAWIFGTTGQVTDYTFDFGNAMWTYFGLVVAQFLLRMHFAYYNSHLKRIRSLQYVNNN